MKTDCIYCKAVISSTWPNSICSDCHEEQLDEVEEQEKSDYDIYREENRRGTL